MSEVEKQEGQKTVVAFIAGLLIGGLLVWVFSSSEPAQAPAATEADAPATETAPSEDDSDMDAPATETTEAADAAPAEEMATVPVGDGRLDVVDQPAGAVVTLENATFPTTDGWVAIRDYQDGVPTGILGAARYSQSQGLMPQEVELLRATEAGQTYVAVFYTEDGSMNESGRLYFDPAGDQQIAGIQTPFTAQ